MPFHHIKGLRRLTKRAQEAADQIIPTVSRLLVEAVPGATEETLSEEIAKRLGTTTQGAHAAMIMPFWLTAPPGGQKILEQALIFDIGRTRHPVQEEETLRFIPRIGITAGFRKRVDAAFKARQRQIARELTGRRR